jgi:hypothetical protein
MNEQEEHKIIAIKVTQEDYARIRRVALLDLRSVGNFCRARVLDSVTQIEMETLQEQAEFEQKGETNEKNKTI